MEAVATQTDVLTRNLYLVKEHVGLFKAANNFDVFEPETGERILECREEKLNPITKLLRFTDFKRMTPFNVEIRRPGGQPLIRVSRGFCFFLSKVKVFDENDRQIGSFKQKLLSVGGSFDVLDPDDQVLCTLKGKWTGWDFRFMSGDVEFAHVTKKWSGLGKELFTSADNYMIQISESVPEENPVRSLILAAVVCIDMVLKE
jgi:uncharacterized protein YxjI